VSKVHIPLDGGLVCGTKSVASCLSTENLCARCLQGLEVRLRAAVQAHRQAGYLVQGAETLVDRFLGAR
jgi:hypothetical protein